MHQPTTIRNHYPTYGSEYQIQCGKDRKMQVNTEHQRKSVTNYWSRVTLDTFFQRDVKEICIFANIRAL